LLVVGFIASYLGTLSYGIFCHTLGFGVGAHPLMYFIVWDMFCGWTAYDSRVHVVAETENQKYYDVATPPWGEFHPWGHLGRQHFQRPHKPTAKNGVKRLKQHAAGADHAAVRHRRDVGQEVQHPRCRLAGPLRRAEKRSEILLAPLHAAFGWDGRSQRCPWL